MDRLIAELYDHVDATEARYASLARPGVRVHPVPYFGGIASARVVTVGVNPSAEEFVGGRWPHARPTPSALRERLDCYFERAPHPWFRVWDDALGHLSVSYREGAAHLDLSPRATLGFQAFRGEPARRDLFLDMVRGDLPWFGRLLAEQCPAVRLVLFAGGVGNIYLDEFVARWPTGPARLEFPEGRPRGGEAPVRWPSIRVGARRVSAFFCGVSPSSGARAGLLVERVEEHREQLRSALGSHRRGRSRIATPKNIVRSKGTPVGLFSGGRLRPRP